jgi:membrane protease YdiL (CAAX protease family)
MNRGAASGITTASAALSWAVMAVAAVVLLGVAAASAGVAAQRVWVLLALAPLAEEALYRSGLQESLLRRWRSPWLGIVATAVVFGMAHVVARGDAGAFVVVLPALAIGAVYARSRRLLPCVLLHAAMNAVWLAWGLLTA